MTFIGIDYSLTSPGITILENDKNFKMFFLSTKKKFQTKLSNELNGYVYPDWTTDIERYTYLANWVLSIIKDCYNPVIYIEGYSYGSTGMRLFQIAENCAVLKYILNINGYNFQSIAPSANKKYLSGKGNANKELMCQSFINKTGLKLHEHFNSSKIDVSPVNDLVDSYSLASLAYSNTSGIGRSLE